jgi:CTP synthase
MWKRWAARCASARGCAVSAEDSLARHVYDGVGEISERHRHRYEFNPAFRETLEKGGLVFSGISTDGKFVEIVELSRDEHPWFLGCQFHP